MDRFLSMNVNIIECSCCRSPKRSSRQLHCLLVGVRFGVGQDRKRSCCAPKSNHLTDRFHGLSSMSSVIDKTVFGPVVHRNQTTSRIAPIGSLYFRCKNRCWTRPFPVLLCTEIQASHGLPPTTPPCHQCRIQLLTGPEQCQCSMR